MFITVKHSFLRVFIISLVFWVSQSYPHEQLENSSSKGRSNPVINNSRDMEPDGKIIFPTESNPYKITKRQFLPSAVPQCRNATFCENPENYPNNFIKEAIKTREDLKYLATIDTAPEIGQRIDVENEAQLCAREDIVIFPKTAKNKENQWLFVINDEEFAQGVRIERCMTDNTACSIIEGLIAGYETVCKQKFIYRQLAAVSSNGSVGPDFFQFPSSCCCHMKFTGNLATRIGVDADKASKNPPARSIVGFTGETE